MARTAIFGAVKAALGLTRRDFLRGAAAASAVACAGVPRGRARPRVAVVGAGAAGLAAAWELRKHGLDATLYEGGRRVGGRIFSVSDAFAGHVVELGAEFIDSTHTDLLALVRDLRLELLDLQSPAEQRFTQGFFFDGQQRSNEELAQSLKPLAPRIQADLAKVSPEVGWNHEGGATALDRTPLSRYFEDIGVGRGWLRELLDVAFVGEMGLETDEQSALNFLFLYSTESGLYGTSDERYKVKGGNQLVIDGLARKLEGHIETSHRLVSLRARGGGYRLAFDRGGGAVEVDADVVIVAIPFTTLRDVDLGLDLPPVKRKVIDELGYGMNTKVLVGARQRIWRAHQHSGGLFTDQPFQSSWDATRGQPGETGVLTLFLGGKTAVGAGAGTALSQWQHFAPGVEAAFPGFGATASGTVHRMHWPGLPLEKGSYTCYRPGQWTTIAGAEGIPVGRVFFAGEHCSREFQGYMQGALESGLEAARAVLKSLS